MLAINHPCARHGVAHVRHQQTVAHLAYCLCETTYNTHNLATTCGDLTAPPHLVRSNPAHPPVALMTTLACTSKRRPVIRSRHCAPTTWPLESCTDTHMHGGRRHIADTTPTAQVSGSLGGGWLPVGCQAPSRLSTRAARVTHDPYSHTTLGSLVTLNPVLWAS